MAEPGTRNAEPRYFTFAVLAFLLTALIGVWAAYDRGGALVIFALLALGVAVALYIAWAGRRYGANVLAGMALACGVIGGVLGAYFLLSFDWQSVGAGKFAALYDVMLAWQRLRPVIPVPEDIQPNVAASALVVLIPLAVGGLAWAWRRQRLAAWLTLPFVIVASVALIATMSRAAWLGLAAGAAMAIYLHWRSRTPHLRRAHLIGNVLLVLVVIGMAGLFVAAVTSPAVGRLLGSTDGLGTASSRAQLWRDGLAIVRDYPFTGSGLGATMMVHASYVLLMHVGFIAHTHNLFLEVAVQQGLLGLAAFLALIGLAVAALARALKQGPASALLLGTAAALTALVVQGMFDAGLYASLAVPFLFLPLGFTFGLAPRAQPETRPSSTLTRVIGLAAVLALCLLLLLPVVRSAFLANLGAVAQTRAELARYEWPRWPVQDALRRDPTIDLAPAIAYYNAALALNPTANRRLGQIELSRGEYEAAQQHLLAAYNAAPYALATEQLLGESYAIAGDNERAAALWGEVLAQYRRNAAWPGQQMFDIRRGWYESIGESVAAAHVARVISDLFGAEK